MPQLNLGLASKLRPYEPSQLELDEPVGKLHVLSYILAITTRSFAPVARDYLQEKTYWCYRVDFVWELLGNLDGPNQREFWSFYAFLKAGGQ